MPAAKEREPLFTNRTTVERRSQRELVITRVIDGPARLVFEVWTKPDLLKRWWAPCSLGVILVKCEADVRLGGQYRYVFSGPAEPMAFSGTYLEVTPYSRLVYSQIFEPARDAGEAIITITFDERRGKTFLLLRELYPSKEALDVAIAAGMEHGLRETLDQLEQLVVIATSGPFDGQVSSGGRG